MNILLQVNKKLLLFILLGVSLIFLFTIISINIDSSLEKIVIKEEDPNFDIINPSFTINNKKQKISVKAKRGNFLTNEVILLENNVIFKSPQFMLTSEKVIFNQKNQTAKSSVDSKFQSDGTTILSEGFEITENGDIIFFDGKTTLRLYK